MDNYKSDLTVAEILDEYTLVLNKGANYGIKLDQKFLIYELSENDIIDPITNESLGKLEIIKGNGIVTHLQKTMCIIKSINYKSIAFSRFSLLSTSKNEVLPFEDPKRGDLVKPL